MLVMKKNAHLKFILFFLSLNAVSFCLEDYSILLMPFKGKSLLTEEDPDQDETGSPHWEESDDSYDNINYKEPVYNASTFIKEWYYNGMSYSHNINNGPIKSFINMENSKLSINKCNINRVYSKAILDQKNTYNPLKSNTYSKIDKEIGNDIFSFIGDLGYKTNINIGETKGNGLDFYFDENEKDSALCGNFGFNINTNSDKTNLIAQLKKKNYINKYVWTLRYLSEDDGIIVVGTEPHNYQNTTFFMSQFCQMKAIPNQSPETAWSFQMTEVRSFDKNNNKINFSQNKVDFLIDRGLIIGTDEYKKKIDEQFFNDLFSKKICYSETVTFHDEEKKTNEEYYVYYCNKTNFMGNIYTIEKSYYNSFPSLELYDKESNMTFSLSKDYLFHTILNRVYFLIVFKKSNTENNIWKLGEPFFSHFQFTFDQDQKTIGFYNSDLEQIPNEEYKKKINGYENIAPNHKNIKFYIIFGIIGLIVIVGLIFLAFYLGKKLNESRKRRANELNDEDFDYSAQKTKDSNENKDADQLVINQS